MDNLPLLQRVNMCYQQKYCGPVNSIIPGNNWIGTNRPMRWPPKHQICDLSISFFEDKSQQYKRHTDSINEFRQNFDDSVNSISNLHFRRNYSFSSKLYSYQDNLYIYVAIPLRHSIPKSVAVPRTPDVMYMSLISFCNTNCM